MDTEKYMLEEFIECYHNNSVLWDTSSEEYQMKGKKDVALNELLEIMRQFKREATVNDVKRKINTLRSSYRRELKKIQDAEDTGQMYKSTIWWFDSMHFIKQGMGRISETLVDEHKLEMSQTDDCEENLLAPHHRSRKRKYTKTPVKIIEVKRMTRDDVFESDNSQTNHNYDYNDCSNGVAAETITTLDYESNERRGNNARPFNSCNCNQGSSNINNYEIFGNLTTTWANKLSKISRTQFLYAEKAINDILFEAEMGTLTRNSVQITISSGDYAANVDLENGRCKTDASNTCF